MQRDSRLGSVAAILTGLLFIVSGLFEVMVPAAENSTMAHAMHPTFFTGYHTSLFLLAILGIAAVPAISRLVAQDDWVSWWSKLAFLAFALLAADNFRQLKVDHTLAHAAMAAEPAVQKTVLIAWQALVELSPQSLLPLMLMTGWMILLSVRMLRERSGARWLAYTGFGPVAAIALVLVGIAMDSRGIRVAAVLAGLLAVPVWFVGQGARLWRAPR